jgi:hypothetical protein
MADIFELITTYLETYDQGLIKQKLIKNTTENTRGSNNRQTSLRKSLSKIINYFSF